MRKNGSFHSKFGGLNSAARLETTPEHYRCDSGSTAIKTTTTNDTN
jgi:hypothetical protein